MTDYAQSRDFETHPLGTGAELARLNDLVRELADALATMQDVSLACDDIAWAKAVEKANAFRPCDKAAKALDAAGAL